MRNWDSYPLTEIRVSSTSTIAQPLPLVRTKDFYIVVSNEDNPPLEITAIRTFQPRRELVAYLEKGKSYQLVFDDPKAPKPNYDLNEFTGRIPAHPSMLAISNPIARTVNASLVTEETSKW